MPSVQACELPDDALLRRYALGGAYADCFVAELPGSVSHSEYVEAFYTTKLFKLERRLLARFAGCPSTDEQAARLAAGTLDSFAVWRVEARGQSQLLTADFRGRTRSWFMVASTSDHRSTRLFFGTAVVPKGSRQTGAATMGVTFHLLLGLHTLYSRALLGAAVARLARSRPDRR